MSDRQTTSRHHFVPEFYYRAWTDPQSHQFWLYYRNPVGRLEAKSRSPTSVGFEWDLYRWKPDGSDFQPGPPDQLEVEFFGQIDNEAGRVHKKLIIEGARSLSAQERADWVVFLKSLMERSPKRIREVELEAGLDETWEASVARLFPGSESDPEILARFAKLNRDAVVRNVTLRAMAHKIYDEQFLGGLLRMEWATIDMVSGEGHYLTGDTPLILNGGEPGPEIHLLSIAISPTRVFTIYRKIDAPEPEDIAEVGQMHNIQIVFSSERVVSSRRLSDDDISAYNTILEQLPAKPSAPCGR